MRRTTSRDREIDKHLYKVTSAGVGGADHYAGWGKGRTVRRRTNAVKHAVWPAPIAEIASHRTAW